MRTRASLAAMLVLTTVPAHAGSVDASYYSRMANLPVLVQNEPPPDVPPFKVFIVRNGNCRPDEIERYVSGSAQLGVGPSRSCIPRRF